MFPDVSGISKSQPKALQVSNRIATSLDSSLLLSFFDRLAMTCCSTIFGTTAIQCLGHQPICGSFLDDSGDEMISRHQSCHGAMVLFKSFMI